MEQVAVSELRANLTRFLKEVESGTAYAVTSRGHEVARLIPPENRMEDSRKALRELRRNAVVGDVVSPLDVEWEAMR